MTVRAVPKPTVEPRSPRQRFKRHVQGVNPTLREQVFERAGRICEWCSEPGGHLDPHHILPRGRGGTDALDNFKALHRRCHRYVHEHPLGAKERGFLA